MGDAGTPVDPLFPPAGGPVSNLDFVNPVTSSSQAQAPAAVRMANAARLLVINEHFFIVKFFGEEKHNKQSPEIFHQYTGLYTTNV